MLGFLHHDRVLAVRLLMAVAMAGVGVMGFVMPRCFAGAARGFMRWSTGLGPAEKERVQCVVDAREQAEGISSTYGRAAGAFAIALAGLELVPFVPFILPYALICLVLAGMALIAYLHFRRATEQRVAPLIRRSPFTALPPLLIAAVVCSLGAALAFALYPPERIGAIVTAVAMLVLIVVAWRIANAPALLLGIDPQCEYAVDERVRIGRARNAALLACAVGYVFVALAEASLPSTYDTLGNVALNIVRIAFIGSLVAYFLPLRARLHTA